MLSPPYPQTFLILLLSLEPFHSFSSPTQTITVCPQLPCAPHPLMSPARSPLSCNFIVLFRPSPLPPDICGHPQCLHSPVPFPCCPQVVQCPWNLPVPSGASRPPTTPPGPQYTFTPGTPSSPCNSPADSVSPNSHCHLLPPALPAPVSLSHITQCPATLQCPQSPQVPCTPAAWAPGCVPRVTPTKWWPTSASLSPLTLW